MLGNPVINKYAVIDIGRADAIGIDDEQGIGGGRVNQAADRAYKDVAIERSPIGLIDAAGGKSFLAYHEARRLTREKLGARRHTCGQGQDTQTLPNRKKHF
jgi:hypothetical protein